MISSVVTGLLYLSLSATTPVRIDTLMLAEQYYEAGDFDHSASLSATLDTADGYSLAARALLMMARYQTHGEDRFKLLTRALASSEQALELQPDHQGAHLQTAMALGLIAEMKHPLTVWLRGYAEEGRQHLDQALKQDPDDPWSNGLLGIWHLQVVRYASAFLGRHLYDASIDEGQYYCNRAERLAGRELYIRFGCAVSLYELDHDLYRERFHKILESIVLLQPRGIEESYIIQDARKLLQQKPAP